MLPLIFNSTSFKLLSKLILNSHNLTHSSKRAYYNKTEKLFRETLDAGGNSATDDSSSFGIFLIAFVVMSIVSLCCISVYYLYQRRSNFAEGENRSSFSNLISGVIRGNSAMLSRSIRSFTNISRSRSRSSADSTVRESPVSDLVQKIPPLEAFRTHQESSQKFRPVLPTISETITFTSPNNSPPTSPLTESFSQLNTIKSLPNLDPLKTIDDFDSYASYSHQATSFVLPTKKETFTEPKLIRIKSLTKPNIYPSNSNITNLSTAKTEGESGNDKEGAERSSPISSSKAMRKTS